MFRPRACPSIVVTAFLSLLFFSQECVSQAAVLMHRAGFVRADSDLMDLGKNCAQGSPADLYSPCDDGCERAPKELRALGRRGDLIAHAREETLEILQTENSCSAWFQGANSDPAGVFRSVRYELDEHAVSNITWARNDRGATFFKHPWGARSFENSGKGSIVQVNAHGPFFMRESHVTELAAEGPSTVAWQMLFVGIYPGDTEEARVAILLHELGHVVGRLPSDNDSLDGQSSRNTVEMLRHCKQEIRLVARKNRVVAID